MTNGILQKNEIKELSQPVTASEIEMIVKPSIEKMTNLCNTKIGNHKGGHAVAHCQIESENPLTFFVLKNGDAIINPEITGASNYFTHKEGCLSVAFRPPKKTKRFNNIKASYAIINDGIKSDHKNVEIEGLLACIFQHEIDHFRNKYIY